MKKEFYWIAIVLLVMWLVRLVDAVIPLDLAAYGLHPRRVSGLIGIITMPFLHASFSHLFSNSVSLVVLLGLLVATRQSPWLLAGLTSVAGASLLWLVGRDANHIGASGLVFGLIGFLIVSGFLHQRLVPVAVAIVVGILFGGTLMSGVLPGADGVSWDGHLCGLAGGVAVAFLAARN
ncbi:rhomboid family intramembrane serine protease [Stieleria sp. TO1_6]|uniref:rhomboid family intramembrane serine protease n=1 Tax=Stieleria tagensis TaxID=2956795 RepID=UPI00209AFC52|nr:rhomboid family intramembrane serine protease [Stieleria tagensis]MCO8122715.1 rhomboid family intramembrane serine protease [Stieleria tagensis]